VETLLAVGLGNPGAEYAATRHNAGWMALDELAARFKRRFGPEGREFDGCAVAIGETEVILIKPLTFMNASGGAVREALERYRLPEAALLVVYDDFQLPLGTLRLRKSGSDGGHNGLASIIAEVGTAEIPRLRLGIGPADGVLPAEGWKDFVLSPFQAEERETVRTMVVRAADAVEALARSGIDRAMNVINTA
jgi:peptidyl-tRNA hydrolase, PTH1 family